MRLRYALVVCAGCDAVFGIHQGTPRDGSADAPAASDGSGSDVACPAHPHAFFIDPTGDVDHDGLDNCHDPCPLLPGTIDSYGSDSDGDGLPDICDPNPHGGASFPDCVKLLDEFTDGDHPAFDPRWASSSSTGAPWQWSAQDCVSSTLAFCSPPGVDDGVFYFNDEIPDIDFLLSEVAIYDPATQFVVEELPDASPDNNSLDGRACGMDGTHVLGVIDDLSGGSATTVATGVNGDNYGTGDAIFLSALPGATWRCEVKTDCDAGGSACNTATEMTGSAAAPGIGRIGIHVGSAEAELHWIAAFAVGSSCE